MLYANSVNNMSYLLVFYVPGGTSLKPVKEALFPKVRGNSEIMIKVHARPLGWAIPAFRRNRPYHGKEGKTEKVKEYQSGNGLRIFSDSFGCRRTHSGTSL